MAAPKDGGWRGVVICQILGLMALMLIVYTLSGGSKLPMLGALAVFAAILIITKPVLVPYIFIASFFTAFRFYTGGFMFTVLVPDLMFLIVLFAFISRNRVDLKAAFAEHRHLLTILILFMLWSMVGFVVNFYSHTPFTNLTSAFFVFKIFQLITIIVLFSQPQWKPHKEKAIFFLVICACFTIIAALGLKIFDGARSLSDFERMTGTLGDHHGALAIVMVLSFGVACGAYFTLKGRFQRLFSLYTGIACLGLLFISGSRSSMLGLMLAMPATVLLGYRIKKNTLISLILSMCAAMAIFWLSPLKDVVFGVISFQPDTVDLSAYGRLLIWERVYEHALYGPWIQKIFGIGIGTFNTLQFNYYLEVGTFTTGAHNNFMTPFVETGIVGLVLWLAIFIEIVRRLIIRSRYGDNAARCFLVATLALLFSCITQETFWPNTSFGRFWLLYMLFYVMMSKCSIERVNMFQAGKYRQLETQEL